MYLQCVKFQATYVETQAETQISTKINAAVGAKTEIVVVHSHVTSRQSEAIKFIVFQAYFYCDFFTFFSLYLKKITHKSK